MAPLYTGTPPSPRGRGVAPRVDIPLARGRHWLGQVTAAVAGAEDAGRRILSDPRQHPLLLRRQCPFRHPGTVSIIPTWPAVRRRHHPTAIREAKIHLAREGAHFAARCRDRFLVGVGAESVAVSDASARQTRRAERI